MQYTEWELIKILNQDIQLAVPDFRERVFTLMRAITLAYPPMPTWRG